MSQLLAVLRDTPEDASANYNLGLAYFREGRLTEALPFLAKATALLPEANDAWKALGLSQLGLKHYAAAVGPLGRVCQRSSGREDACYLAGRTLTLLARYDDAMEPLRKALRTAAPEDQAKVNRAMGLNLENLGDAAEAERYFRTAIRTYQPSTDAHDDPRLDYGSFLLRQGRASEALGPLQQALATSQKSALCNAQTGRAMLDLNRPGDALPYLEKAVALDPLAWGVRLLLGKAYLRVGRSEEGERELRKGQESWARANPESSRAR